MFDAKKKRLYLVDGMAVAYRAFYAFMRNPLINSKGENVSAVFGFSNIILNLLDREKPDYFAVVFDSPEPTFRHERYAEYKSQRAEMPQEMIEQLPRLHQLLNVLQIPAIRKPGFEADDIMGTLAKTAAQEGWQTVLVTGDKDLMQLVNDDTIIFNPKKSREESEWLDRDGVIKKLGLPPEKIVDYLALAGDSSDNIPGVPQIGPKTALELLQQYGSLDRILENIPQISNKRIRLNLEEHKDKALLSRELATIDCNVPLDWRPANLVQGTVQDAKALAFFQEMEFRGLADRFAPKPQQTKARYTIVRTEKELRSLVESLENARKFAFDTETTSIDPMRAELVGLSFSWQEGEAYYIPVKGPHDLISPEEILPLQTTLRALAPVFQDEQIGKCGHNSKYDMIVLAQHGIPVNGLEFDTMIASYLIDPTVRQHNLDALSLAHLGVKKIPTVSLISSGKNQKTMDQVAVAQVAEYACEDAEVTWRLAEQFRSKLAEYALEPLFRDVEMPLVKVLMTMERNGVSLDIAYLNAMSRDLEVELVRLEQKIYELAGTWFNISSPKQLATILFEKLKLPTLRRTKTGFSTDVSVLEELAGRHELPQQILEYRQLAKLKSTYVDALPTLIHPKTKRVHTSYNQTVAATGRLSSSDPNLQNIPIRTEIGRRIRRAFVPANSDYLIFDADYSQIELRIMAHLSQDKTLLDSFKNDEDVHTRTAALVFSVPADQVTPDQRRKAKEVNFGIMYGMGPYGLAQRLGISPEEGAQFIQTYFANYPDVQRFTQQVIREAHERGFVTTLLNRRRYLPEINSDNRRMREFAERTAINTPIQGSAADLIKVAMLNIHRRLQEKFSSKMIMQVHDELVFEAHKDELQELQAIVRYEMEHAIELTVPIKVDMGFGANWLEAH